jgi:ATP-binding protein involved in chromosome partitioning
MTLTEHELENKLSEIDNPVTDEDIVSLGVLDDLRIEDGKAIVSLALNTPYAPAEMELGNRIRETISKEDLEPELRATAGAEHGFDEEVLPKIRNVIAVASGKGGVGKTTITANLAAGLAEKGARVGVLDADVHGPNIPRLLPIEEEPDVTPDNEMIPPTSGDVQVMSMGFLVRDADDPAILRGPMVNNVMNEFVENVAWGRLDYLLIDLPPGTGDASLDLLQTLPVSGAVVVTTPQRMALDDARMGLGLFERHDTPILGVVENMSGYHCPGCGDVHQIFGSNGADEIVEDYGVERLAKLPVHPAFGAESEGPVVRDEESELRESVLELTERVADRISEENMQRVAEATKRSNEEAVRTIPSVASEQEE